MTACQHIIWKLDARLYVKAHVPDGSKLCVSAGQQHCCLTVAVVLVLGSDTLELGHLSPRSFKLWHQMSTWMNPSVNLPCSIQDSSFG